MPSPTCKPYSIARCGTELISTSHDDCFPAFFALNEVLSNPENGKTAFKVGQHSEDDFYTWMETHPVQQGAFHRFMEAQFAALPTWLDAVSFESEIAQDASADDVVFVDVGGGNGSQCAALKKAFPHLQGRIILQDRPPVLENALAVEGMEKMSHDFLTEQPVKSECHLRSHPVDAVTKSCYRCTSILLPPNYAQLRRCHLCPDSQITS